MRSLVQRRLLNFRRTLASPPPSGLHLVCAGCGERVAGSTAAFFRCPNADAQPKLDHVLEPEALGAPPALAEDAAGRCTATWNFDYRAVGHPGGGYPGTLKDVAAATDHLAGLDEPLDLNDVTLVGHSAGGHLALWAAGRKSLEPGDPGNGPVIVPHTVVAQAAVVDLYAAAVGNLGSGAVQGFLGGGPEDVPDHYRVASPAASDARIITVHGRYDLVVPIGQSGLLVGAERIFDDAGTHFDVLDPRHDLWRRTLDVLGIP